MNQRGFQAGAYVHADIEVVDDRCDGRKEVEAYLTVADCGRAAQLDFSADDKRFARNALYKARLLKKTVDAFVDALERAVGEAELS
ncbi:hypothetical protein [Myceligenerans crystallogenes]|uniref:Uncharacterized protein n=1 Tax=Myceligenerans crystallogenes TaxID=316335 RepID=A0ABP4ZHA6_9MICO